MYKVLAGCEIALNSHIDAAGDHANNMRLYEATGMGALLLTDRKSDLDEYFEVDREILTYVDADECAAKIRYALAHRDEARQIADRGQRRTIAENSYADRMREFAERVEDLL